MNDHVTVVRLDTRPGRTPGSSAPLPRDLLEQVRRRVQMLSLLMLVAFAIDPTLALVTLLGSMLSGDPLSQNVYVSFGLRWVDVAGVLVSAGLWLLARRRDVEPAKLHLAGSVYMVLICFVIGLTSNWQFYVEDGVLPALTWVPAVIIFFPLVLPGRPRRMLVAGLAAAATSPAAIAVLHVSGRVVADADAYASATIKSLLAVMFAYVGARAVYGLGREVAVAREMGSYRLEKRLGEGGMGEVWQARHRMLARPAAIKLIRPSLANGGGGASPQGADLRLRFAREAQAIATLRSPHTVDVFDFGVTEDGAFYYAMELLDGVDADTLVQRFGPVPVERVVHLLGHVCHSLSEAHTRGLVHRDIKPANVFICRYGEELDFVKVLDFGLVKALGDRGPGIPALTSEHVVQGTPAFMAPEQALGRTDIDGRADIYAIGCVAYWLLTGALVFEGDTPMAMVTHHARTAPLGPSARAAQPIPPALDRLVLACLAKDPDARPQTARELSERLGAVECTAAWTPQRARAWWETHQPAADGALGAM
jgi:serine/threonine-protein kinase